MLTDDFIGKTIGGCRIIKRLGEGGMGIVYEAEQSSLARKVAIKFLASHISNNKDFVSRFFREARSAAGINHPNVMQVYNVGQEGNAIYMITELVKGKTLNQIVTEKGRLSEEEALSIVHDVALALIDAEKKEIVHRDLKPDNVMITEDKIVKVMDFGLAKNVGSSTQAITQTGTVIGTPQYMSPEQIKGEKVDIRSDIYSLGLILFYLTTGKTAYEGNTPVTVFHNQVYTPLPDPRKINLDLSGSVSNIIIKMTRKNPEERFQSPKDIINAIKLIQKGDTTFSISLKKETIEPTILIPKGKKTYLYLRRAFIVILVILGISFLIFKGANIIEKKARNGLAKKEDRIVLRWDTKGNITFLNNYGKEFFGYSIDEILEKNIIGTIVPKTESSGRDLEKMIKEIETHPERYKDNVNENICSDGKLVWIQWTNKPLYDKKGNIREIISIGKEIKDIVKVKKKILTMNAAKGKDKKSYKEYLKDGEDLLGKKQWDKAIAVFESALRDYPEEMETKMWLNLAILKKEKDFLKSVSSEIISPGELTLLVSPFSYFYYKDSTGQKQGFDIELMRMFADSLKLSIKTIEVSIYKELIPALLENKGDIIASGMTVTDKRKELINFSSPYFTSTQVLVSKADFSDIESIEDIIDKRIGYIPGTAYEKTVKELKIKESIPLPNWKEMVKFLEKGRIDAYIDDLPSAIFFEKENPQLEIAFTFNKLESFGYGLKKDVKYLKEALDHFLKKAEKNGTLKKLYKKYFEN
ncbi:MAG: transporter substrate-binding domain-containing protein [Thermodesulfobacteriota bacterium]|nr:transporter substrate-binding domain-containing protein [Thermodesulfobacteriota bacterium]